MKIKWMFPFWAGLSKFVTLKLILSNLLFTKGNRTLRYGVYFLIISFATYSAEVLFAISLQRFLGSANLIEQVTDTRFLGGIRSMQLEALFLIFFGVLRSLLQALGTLCIGQTLIEFETFMRKLQIYTIYENRKLDSGRDAALFGSIVIGGSNFIANLFVYIGKILITILLLVTLGIYSLSLTLQVVMIVILSMPIQRFLVNRTLRFSYLVREAIVSSTSEYLKTVKNFEFLKVHLLIKQKVQNNLSQVKSLAESRQKQYLFSSLRTFLPQTLGVLTLVFIIAGERIQTLDNKSEIVPFLYLLLRLFQNIADVTRMNSVISQDWPNIKMLYENVGSEMKVSINQLLKESSENQQLLNLQKASNRELDSFGVGLRFDKVSYFLQSEKRCLKVENMTISAGNFVVLNGESGIGKTTFLRLITGYLAPDSGNIEFLFPVRPALEGRLEPTNSTNKVITRSEVRLSYLAAESPLITGSIIENLQFGKIGKLEVSDALAALHAVKLNTLVNSEEQLTKLIHESGSGLSSGQRQRLGFARALLQKPSIIILDEALSQIDDESRVDLLKILHSLKGSTTIFSVSHNFDLSRYADKMIKFETTDSSTWVKLEGKRG